MKKSPGDVDAYIAAAPREARAKLVQLRRLIKAAAPEAEEGISYRMPYYMYRGAVVGFAAFKNHIGLFVVPTVIEEHAAALKGYQTAKGTVRLPIDKPLPVALVNRLVKARVEKNRARRRSQSGHED